ncbi:MAG: hypothetical protein H6644_04385 [Caldilineaceae bacterium]|nr:hypothetical protein [Caldilineaceae bacterium]
MATDAGPAATLTVTAGSAPGAQWADGALDSSSAAPDAVIALRDVDGGRQEYRARPLAAPRRRLRWNWRCIRTRPPPA